jgi:hypothetical protein
MHFLHRIGIDGFESTKLYKKFVREEHNKKKKKGKLQ